MKLGSKVFVFGAILIVVSCSLQSNHNIVQDNLRSSSLLDVNHAVKIISYLPLFLSSHEQFLQIHKVSPCIKCTKCNTKILDLGEFDGGLIGWAFNGFTKNEISFEKIKVIFDERLDVVSKKSNSDLVNCMVRIANETKQLCADCHTNSDAWAKC